MDGIGVGDVEVGPLCHGIVGKIQGRGMATSFRDQSGHDHRKPAIPDEALPGSKYLKVQTLRATGWLVGEGQLATDS